MQRWCNQNAFRRRDVLLIVPSIIIYAKVCFNVLPGISQENWLAGLMVLLLMLLLCLLPLFYFRAALWLYPLFFVGSILNHIIELNRPPLDWILLGSVFFLSLAVWWRYLKEGRSKEWKRKDSVKIMMNSKRKQSMTRMVT